jgi:hypothetical protein
MKQRQSGSLRAFCGSAIQGAILIGAAACGDGNGTATDIDTRTDPTEPGESAILESQPVASTADEELLHSVSTSGQTIDFVRIAAADGEEQRIVAMSKRTRDSVDVVEALFEDYGPLTMLEVFRAVAPSGTVPHPRLVESHVIEAGVLGRTSAEVRVVSAQAAIDAQSAGDDVEKATLRAGAAADCRTALFTPDEFNVWTRVSMLPHESSAGSNAGFVCTGGETGTFQSPGTNVCTRGFAKPLKVGACGFSDDSSAAVFQVGFALAPTEAIAFRSPDVLSQNEVFSFVSSGAVTPARMVIVIFPPEGISSVFLMGSGVGEPP